MVTFRDALAPICGLIVIACTYPLGGRDGLSFDATAATVQTKDGTALLVEVTVTNRSDNAQRLDIGASCPFIFHVLDEKGTRIWRDYDLGHCLADIGQELILEPRASETLERTLLIDDVLRAGIEPGEYMVAVHFPDPGTTGTTVEVGRFRFDR